MVALGTFLDFAYFSIYFQIKETAWNRGDAIFSEPELIWSLSGEFWKILIKIKQKNNKNLLLQICSLNSSSDK